jgi:hypothetical protein
MAQLMPQTTAAGREPAVTPIPNREKALKILSKSIYKELRQNGYEPRQIVALATEIVSLVTSDIKDDVQLA